MFVVHVRTSEKLNFMDNILLVAEARGENMALGTIRKRRNKTNLIRHIKFINVCVCEVLISIVVLIVKLINVCADVHVSVKKVQILNVKHLQLINTHVKCTN